MTRREAREILFCLLFESEFRGDESAQQIYTTSVENREICENDYIRDTYFGIFDKLGEIDAVIGEHANGWKTERLNNVSRAVLRLCVYEMMYKDDIPVNVSINEAIELIKKFDDERARPFVNGVLNSVKVSLESQKGEI